MATLAEAFAAAVQYHRAGNLRQAQLIYEEILQVEPRHADSLNLLAVIAFQNGNPALALEIASQAVSIDGSNVSYLSNPGVFYAALGELHQAVKCYHRVLPHWREVVPTPMLEVRYEDLVANQETISREMIAFCGLEWSDQCLNFHRNPRPVRTASTLQVRRPMYRTATGRRKNYTRHLGPLMNALGEAGRLR